MPDVEATCPSCSKKATFHVEVPQPAVPVATITAASDEVSASVKRMEEKLKSIPDNFCTQFPELCSRVEASNEAVVSRLDQIRTEIDHDHATLDEGLLERWQACPHCKQKWEEKVAEITAKALAASKAEVPAPAPAETKPPEAATPKVEPPPATKEKTVTEEAEVDDGEFHLSFGKRK